jgi:hypothetical protein
MLHNDHNGISLQKKKVSLNIIIISSSSSSFMQFILSRIKISFFKFTFFIISEIGTGVSACPSTGKTRNSEQQVYCWKP